jgi:hypothetical protein
MVAAWTSISSHVEQEMATSILSGFEERACPAVGWTTPARAANGWMI